MNGESGWLVIDALMSREEIAAVLAACDELLGAPAEQRLGRDKPAQGTRHLAELDSRNELVAEVVSRPALSTAVSEFIGPPGPPVQVELRSPQPGFGAQKLHADDRPKLDDGPDRVATAIIPLVAFTASNGATRLVPQSHRRPDLQRRSGSLDHHPDEIRLIGPAGCAFVFSGHVLHSGTRNNSAADRPALQVVWQRR